MRGRYRERNQPSQAIKISLGNSDNEGESLEEPPAHGRPQLVEDPEFMEEAQFLEELQLEIVKLGQLDPEDLGSSPDFATNLMLELE